MSALRAASAKINGPTRDDQSHDWLANFATRIAADCVRDHFTPDDAAPTVPMVDSRQPPALLRSERVKCNPFRIEHSPAPGENLASQCATYFGRWSPLPEKNNPITCPWSNSAGRGDHRRRMN